MEEHFHTRTLFVKDWDTGHLTHVKVTHSVGNYKAKIDINPKTLTGALLLPQIHGPQIYSPDPYGTRTVTLADPDFLEALLSNLNGQTLYPHSRIICTIYPGEHNY